jgi:alpha-L-fucosidase
MGAWLRKYGDSVYGTRGGPIGPRPWGVTTRKGKTVFLHVFDWPDPLLALPPLGAGVRGVRALKDAARVASKPLDGGGLLLDIPPAARDELDTVLAVELAD